MTTTKKKLEEKVVVVWVSEETKNTIPNQLKSIPPVLKHCPDGKACVDLLKEPSSQSKRVIIVASPPMGKELVKKIDEWKQIDAIYIIDTDLQADQAWTKPWPKIKQTFHNIRHLCDELTFAVNHYDSDLEPSSMAVKGKLDSSFMYTALFKEVLISMDHDPQAHRQLAEQCPEKEKKTDEQQKYLELFKNTYDEKEAIKWYTREGFLYRKLNEALRELKADVLVNMGFFVRHVHQQLEEEHKRQYKDVEKEPFKVYRGQGLSPNDLEKLKQTIGQLYAFNNFLSTSQTERVSVGFALKAEEEDGKLPVLFIYHIDPKTPSTPFACVKMHAEYVGEDEILFSMHSVFRIEKVKQMEVTDQQQNVRMLDAVEMTLADENDEDLKQVKDKIRSDLQGGTPLQRLGYLLMKVNQLDRAKTLYETIISKQIDDGERAYCLHQLGLIHSRTDKHDEAMRYYKMAIEIEEKLPSGREANLAAIYTNVGSAYLKSAKYREALGYYEKAREMQEKDKTKRSDLATTLSNIGALQLEMGKYTAAKKEFEEALRIFKETLPANHPSLLVAKSNIAAVEFKERKAREASEQYESVLGAQKQVLPKGDPSLKITQSNLGLCYTKLSIDEHTTDHDKEIKRYFEEATKPAEEDSLSRMIVLNNQGLNLARTNQDRAIECYIAALQIKDRLKLTEDHPVVASLQHNLGAAHYKNKDYAEAEKCFRQAEKIRKKLFNDEKHPDRKRTVEWLEAVERKLVPTK